MCFQHSRWLWHTCTVVCTDVSYYAAVPPRVLVSLATLYVDDLSVLVYMELFCGVNTVISLSDGHLGPHGAIVNVHACRCADKMYFLNGSLYRHMGGDTDLQGPLDDK